MNGRISFFDAHPAHADLKAEVLDGLAAEPKALSPKFFYDAEGSRLFDAICELPEYYPTRTEMAILRRHARAIAEACGRDSVLVEPGSGSSTKVRLLMNAIRPACYVPMDICRDHVFGAARALGREFPWLTLHAVCADFHQLDAIDLPEGERTIAFFPGSTVGNFEPELARRFLYRLGCMVGPTGGMLIGVDLKKDPLVLDAAYNDSRGVTAAFNLNLLTRINRELGAGFRREDFRHCAFYDERRGRVEMHLVSRRRHTVPVDGVRVPFEDGEAIHTENSYKYTVDEFADLAATAGLQVERVWTDPLRLFSVHYLTVDPSAALQKPVLRGYLRPSPQ